MSDPVKLYNANDGLTGRPYTGALDQVEQRQMEDLYAARGGREPDYDNMGVTPGIKLVTASQLLDAATVNVAHQPAEEGAAKAQAAVDNLDVEATAEIPVEAFEEPEAEEVSAETTAAEEPEEEEEEETTEAESVVVEEEEF